MEDSIYFERWNLLAHIKWFSPWYFSWHCQAYYIRQPGLRYPLLYYCGDVTGVSWHSKSQLNCLSSGWQQTKLERPHFWLLVRGNHRWPIFPHKWPEMHFHAFPLILPTWGISHVVLDWNFTIPKLSTISMQMCQRKFCALSKLWKLIFSSLVRWLFRDLYSTIIYIYISLSTRELFEELPAHVLYTWGITQLNYTLVQVIYLPHSNIWHHHHEKIAYIS